MPLVKRSAILIYIVLKFGHLKISFGLLCSITTKSTSANKLSPSRHILAQKRARSAKKCTSHKNLFGMSDKKISQSQQKLVNKWWYNDVIDFTWRFIYEIGYQGYQFLYIVEWIRICIFVKVFNISFSSYSLDCSYVHMYKLF